MIEPPLDEGETRDLAIVKAAISFVPGIGGPLAEFVGLHHDNLGRRQEAWMIQVSDAINELKDRFDVSRDQLEQNEAFVSFALQATDVALRNHRQEKLNALRNALVAVGSPEQTTEDMAFQFLRYIQELTVTHLSILQTLALNRSEFLEVKTLERAFEMVLIMNGQAFERDAFRVFLRDLDARGLVHSSDLEDLPEYQSKASYIADETDDRHPLTVTPLGSDFLQFINGRTADHRLD